MTVALLVFPGCSGEATGKKPVVVVPWGSDQQAAVSPRAVWAYTPAEPKGLLGRVVLDDKRELYFGRDGERWLYDPAQQEAEAAGDLAEQELISVGRSAGGSWLFIGASGAIFEAPEPLAPFQRALSAPEPVVRVEANGQALLAVTTRGTLLQSSDGGATFRKAVVEAPFVADVALLENGQGLLLAMPERLFSTRDGGRSWSPLGARTVGASRIHRHGEDSLLVQGVQGSLLWRDGAPPKPSGVVPGGAVFTLPVALAPAPSAADVRAGRGFFRGVQALTVRPPAKRGGAWFLGEGKLGQRQALTELAGTEGCGWLSIDGNESWIVAACTTGRRGASLGSVKFLRYSSSLATPEVLASGLEASPGEARVQVSRDGRVLALGACRPGTSRAACDGESMLLLPRWESAQAAPPATSAPPAASSAAPGAAGEASLWVSVAAPGQSGKPLAVRFGQGGASAYMVAQRGKTRDLGLFVSHDGGKTFEGRDLGLASALGDVDRRLLTGLHTASLSTHDDGIVSIAFEGHFGALIAVTDEDGRVLSVSSPPVASSLTRVGVAGRRFLVVDRSSVAESLDGGMSWQPLGESTALRCPERGACDHAVTCGVGGCLVGHEVSRVGWGGQGEGRRAIEPDMGRVGSALLRATPPAVSCRLSKDKWQPLPKGAELPGAHKADRGKTAWASTAFNAATGQVSVVHGLMSPAGKIEEAVLLPASREPHKQGMHLSSTQVEGVAAVRFALPQPTPTGLGKMPTSAEVAWENLFEGKLSRATLSGLELPPMPWFSQSTGVSQIELPLLSISNGGVFVRMSGDGPMFFVDHRGKSERSPFPDAPSHDQAGEMLPLRPEAVRVDNKSLAVGFFDNLVVRFRSASDFDATALFPAASSGFGAQNQITFSYLGSAPVLVHTGVIPRVGVSAVSLFPFQASGPLLGARTAGPSQGALVERYRPCTAQDRARSVRVVAAPEQGTRRGVLIDGPDGSRFASLVSGDAVLYGTAESPCGGAIEALSPRSDGQESERALVMLSDLEHGWFFRAGVGDTVEVRAMTCKITPNAPLPQEVQSAIDSGVTGRPQRPVRPRRPRRP